MKPTNYEKLIQKELQEKTGDPTLTLELYLLQCARDDTTDRTAADFLGVPLNTYRFWRRKYSVSSQVRTHKLKSEAGQLELIER